MKIFEHLCFNLGLYRIHFYKQIYKLEVINNSILVKWKDYVVKIILQQTNQVMRNLIELIKEINITICCLLKRDIFLKSSNCRQPLTANVSIQGDTLVGVTKNSSAGPCVHFLDRWRWYWDKVMNYLLFFL